MTEGNAECGMLAAVSESFAVLPLAPGFSRVSVTRSQGNRFNGFPGSAKPLKRFGLLAPSNTRLKPGANGRQRKRSGGVPPERPPR